jgi:hypothetical protein
MPPKKFDWIVSRCSTTSFTASFSPFILDPNAAIGVGILSFLFPYACVRYAMDEHPKDVTRFDEEIANGRPRLERKYGFPLTVEE